MSVIYNLTKNYKLVGHSNKYFVALMFWMDVMNKYLQLLLSVDGDEGLSEAVAQCLLVRRLFSLSKVRGREPMLNSLGSSNGRRVYTYIYKSQRGSKITRKAPRTSEGWQEKLPEPQPGSAAPETEVPAKIPHVWTNPRGQIHWVSYYHKWSTQTWFSYVRKCQEILTLKCYRMEMKIELIF